MSTRALTSLATALWLAAGLVWAWITREIHTW